MSECRRGLGIKASANFTSLWAYAPAVAGAGEGRAEESYVSNACAWWALGAVCSMGRRAQTSVYATSAQRLLEKRKVKRSGGKGSTILHQAQTGIRRLPMQCGCWRTGVAPVPSRFLGSPLFGGILLHHVPDHRGS